jgi:hypothetical protein
MDIQCLFPLAPIGGANPANNRPVGVTVNAKGNLSAPSAGNAHDNENHLISSPLHRDANVL